jgi:hypothetical protein
MDFRVNGKPIRIASIHGDKYRSVNDPNAAIEELRRQSISADLFTFMETLPETRKKHDFPAEWDNYAALDVSSFENWWKNQIGFKARNKAKQAEKKGVVVREVSFDEILVNGIHKIYNECPVRQGRRFPHYGRTLDLVRRESATFLDSSVFIGAYLQEELIGFVKLTTNQSATQAGLMHIVSLVRERDKAPTNALLMHAVRSCADRKIPHLVYSNFSYGKKEHDGLSDFKERNGFKKVEVPRYYIPLTPVGELALKLGLHRRATDRLPETVASRLRQIRARWYALRFHSVGEV